MDRYEIDHCRSLQRKQHAARVQELRHERKTEEERLVVLKKSLQTKLNVDQTKGERSAA
jgi:hypothetical protein